MKVKRSGSLNTYMLDGGLVLTLFRVSFSKATAPGAVARRSAAAARRCPIGPPPLPMSDDEEETAKLRAMRRVAMRMDARGGAADAGTHI